MQNNSNSDKDNCDTWQLFGTSDQGFSFMFKVLFKSKTKEGNAQKRI